MPPSIKGMHEEDWLIYLSSDSFLMRFAKVWNDIEIGFAFFYTGETRNQGRKKMNEDEWGMRFSVCVTKN